MLFIGGLTISIIASLSNSLILAFHANVHFQKKATLSDTSCLRSTDQNSYWLERDKYWRKDSNVIEYVIGQGITFESLGAIGINISVQSSSRNVIPHHLISGNDLFCNREINMKHIEAVGFDMDWTLAQYNMEFDLLAYNGAKEKLVTWLGYPKEVLDLQYLYGAYRRGCVVDKKRGNIVKLDRHKYVRVAEHGLTPLRREERQLLYQQTFVELQSFGGPNFVSSDTPFALVDCCMFAQLVDLKDKLDRRDGDSSLLYVRAFLRCLADLTYILCLLSRIFRTNSSGAI